MLLPKKLSMNN